MLQTDASNRLNTVYFGAPLAKVANCAGAAAQHNFNDSNAGFYPNAYTPAGTWNLSEPAFKVTHADGRPNVPGGCDAVLLGVAAGKRAGVVDRNPAPGKAAGSAVQIRLGQSIFHPERLHQTTFQGQYLKEA